MPSQQPKYTAATNVALIQQAIAEHFRSTDDVCAVQPVGTAERTHNLQAVANSQVACEQARLNTAMPAIEVGDPDPISESITMTIAGDYGQVLVQVTESPLARYAKTTGEETIRGEAVVDSPMLWARLARWASSGKKKFTCKD